MSYPGIQSWLCAFTLLLLPTASQAFDSKAYIERSIELIEESEYLLSRAYLTPATIDYRLSRGERSRAYYLRGYSYFAQGLFVSAGKDYHRALQFNPGNPGALTALGDLYFRGLGVEKNQALAFELFQQAAEYDYPNAMYQLGYAYLEGAGVEQDLEQARKWLSTVAEDGNTSAMGLLARSYRDAYTDAPEPEQALQWYQRAVAAGSSDALVAMAYMYQNGELGSADPTLAIELFQQAATAGSSMARVALAHLYLTGSGVEQNASRAYELFTQAADQGNPAGYLGLGHLYETGEAGTENAATAMSWYRKAAEAEVVPAQMRLVYLLLAEDDVAGALKWLARAAAQGTVEAHNDYAWLLATTADERLRDGELALKHAKLAVAERPSPSYLDTLAAAYAELGKFADAVATQQRAIAAIEEEDAELLAELEAHLNAYQAGKAWRD